MWWQENVRRPSFRFVLSAVGVIPPFPRWWLIPGSYTQGRLSPRPAQRLLGLGRQAGAPGGRTQGGACEGEAEAERQGKGLGDIAGVNKEKWILWDPRATGSSALIPEQPSQE